MYAAQNKYYQAKKQGKNDSKFEAGKAQELALLKKAGEIIDFQEQVKIPLEVNGYLVCTYKIDFVIEHLDGTTEYLETKGYPTETWKLKWKLFEALFTDKPNTKLTIEFQGKAWKPRKRRVR